MRAAKRLRTQKEMKDGRVIAEEDNYSGDKDSKRLSEDEEAEDVESAFKGSLINFTATKNKL